MNPKNLITELARTFEHENDAAADLWTWLPSHHFATRYFGDHAGNFRPSNSELMREAASLFSLLRNPRYDNETQCLSELRDSVYEAIDWDRASDAAGPTARIEPPTSEEIRAVLKEMKYLPARHEIRDSGSP